jgi:hypothetical protein
MTRRRACRPIPAVHMTLEAFAAEQWKRGAERRLDELRG